MTHTRTDPFAEILTLDPELRAMADTDAYFDGKPGEDPDESVTALLENGEPGIAAETVGLTRAEDAYAHLADFQRDDTVDVAGRRFFMPGRITVPLRPGLPSKAIEDAYVIADGAYGARQVVRVRDLLYGDRTVTRQR